MAELNLEFEDVWKERVPKANAPDLLIEQEAKLLHLSSDFTLLHDFGCVGPVECPIAYDAKQARAYRYVCASTLARGDFSALRTYDLKTGLSRTELELPLNQWVLWLLEWIPGGASESGQLFGLLATDRPADDRVVIEHRLMALKPGEAQARMRPVCRDAYRPLAFSRQRRELVFAGAEGIYLMNLRGVRVATFPGEDSSGQGAAFDPSGAARVVLGGDGLFLWDIENHRYERLTRRGRHPVWSSDQRGIWYRESSSDLYYYDLEAGESRCVFSIVGNRNPECWHARPAAQTSCGRYVAVSVTAKQLKGVSRKANATGSRERVYAHMHRLYVLDLERREYWSREGLVNHVRWAE